MRDVSLFGLGVHILWALFGSVFLLGRPLMKKLRMRVASTILVLLFVAASVPGFAASPVLTRTLTPDRSLRFGPPVSDRVIQSFDYGSGDGCLFRTAFRQATHCCPDVPALKRERARSATASRLPGYGHGESLEVYTENSRTYAWVGSERGGWHCPTTIRREVSLIEYIKAPAGSKKASYRRMGTLTNLGCRRSGKIWSCGSQCRRAGRWEQSAGDSGAVREDCVQPPTMAYTRLRNLRRS